MKLFLKNVVFTVLVPGTVAVYIPFLMTRDVPTPSAWTILGSLPFFGGGGAIYLWCVWDFAAFGRGTPAPIDAPKKLVMRGLYRYTRNPMYLGVITVILGWAVLYQVVSLALYAAVLAGFFHLFVILYEEPQLTELFGAEYAAYRNTVNRWLPLPVLREKKT